MRPKGNFFPPLKSPLCLIDSKKFASLCGLQPENVKYEENWQALVTSGSWTGCGYTSLSTQGRSSVRKCRINGSQRGLTLKSHFSRHWAPSIDPPPLGIGNIPSITLKWQWFAGQCWTGVSPCLKLDDSSEDFKCTEDKQRTTLHHCEHSSQTYVQTKKTSGRCSRTSSSHILLWFYWDHFQWGS